MSVVIAGVLISGYATSSGLTTLLLAASCFWLTSYILVNITVLVLRKRYPNAPGRNKRLTLFGIPQIVCIIGDVFMIWNIAEGEARTLIYKIFVGLMVVMLGYALIWVKLIKKAPAFKSASMEEINCVTLEGTPNLKGNLEAI